MPVSDVNGVELYWERAGSGPRLLFCNGSGATMADARPLLDALAGGFDLLAWDYRGFGGSGPVTRACRIADVAADADGLLELPVAERGAAGLRIADSRWDDRWLDGHPGDRALAERMTARQGQRDPAAMPELVTFLQARAD